MSVSRLTHITPIGVEQMGDLADSLKDPDVLRLENLDTDLRPPQSALDVTKQAVDDDHANRANGRERGIGRNKRIRHFLTYCFAKS